MPSWKKVIISGSRAELSSVFAPSITGSLQGTASFAVSASRAVTASYITGSSVFGPYGSNSVISASYAVFATTASFSDRTTQTDLLVLNQAGFTINKGTVVRITGSNNASDIPRITTASYEDDNNSANTLGITTQQITNGSTGYVITEGVLTGINTTGWTSGTLLFLGATGSITASAPQAPLHAVRLGQVIREQNNNGSMHVRIDNGYEIGELHDVIDSTTTTSFGDLLVKSGSVWNTGKQLTGSYGLTGSLTVTGSTATDLVRITQTGTGNAFRVEDSTNPDNTPFLIDNVGNVMIGTTSSNGTVTIATNGADGLVLDTDTASNTQSSRLFFKNSGSFTDFSIRNTGQLLIIAASASASVSSGTGRMYISASGEVSIGTGYSPFSSRGAALQVSGSINIEDGFAYKQDGENVIYIQRNTGLTAGAFNNTIAGMDAAAGTAYFDQLTAFGYGALYQSSGSDNTAVGYAAGSGYSGSNATLIGWGAGLQAKASNQTAVGESAGAYNTGSNQTATGYQAGYLNTGSNQTAIGSSAGWKNTATQQTAVGLQAGYLNIGVAQTALGQQAGQENSGSTQTAVGYAAGFQNSGSIQVAIGAQAGRDNKGANQTATGYEAGRLNIEDFQSAYGYRAGYENSGSNQTAIGSLAGRFNSGSNQVAMGISAGEQNTGNTQTAIGGYAGYQNSGSSQTVTGYSAGYANTADYQTATGYSAGYANTGSAQTAYGYQAGTYNSGSNQTATGFQAGVRNLALNQTATGYQAGYQNTGSNQTVTGYQAGFNNSGSNQTAIGNSAGESNRGNNQTALGSQAGFLNTGSNQTAVGYVAGYQNSGSDNTNIGYQAGTYTTGVTINTGSVQSVFLGSQTTAGGGNRTNQIVIGYGTSGIGDNSVVIGNTAIATTALRGNVGINTTTPTYTLQIHAAPTASIRLQETGSGGNKRLDLTIDASGIARMSANQSAQQIAFDTVGAERIRITKDGDVGINTTTPLGKLTVSGSGGYLSYNDTDAAGNLLVLSGSSNELVRIDVSALSASVSTAFSYGIRGINDTVYTGYGKVTDAFMYASNFANGLNIINYGEGTKEDYIRFYAGTNATATPNIHIQGSGSNKGFVGINKIDPIAQLDVNGNTIISGSLTTTSSVAFKAYTSATSFPGTAAGYLAFDSAGNILTTAGVAAGAAGNNTEIQYNNAGALAGTSAITFDGTTLRATGSFTGSLIGALTGTASFAVSASRAITASFALTSSFITASGVFGPYGSNSVITASYAAFAPSTIQTSGSTIYSTNPLAGPNFNTTQSIFIGTGSGTNTTSSLLSNLIAIGPYAGWQNVGTNQTAIGNFAGYSNTGPSQTAIGSTAGQSNTGNFQTALGNSAGSNNSGNQQTAIGMQAGQSNTGDFQTALGYSAGFNNSGNNQTAVGFAAGIQNTGKDNTNIGYDAGRYETNLPGSAVNSGSYESIYIGSSTKSGGPQRQNQIVIGYDAQGLGSNSVLLGNSSITLTALRGQVGVNTTTPNAQLDVNGDTIITGSFTVTGSYNSPSGNTIDSNALIQAGLLYLSNNF